jgi:hypothetical protein
MKTFYKTLLLGVFFAGSAFVAPAFAQDVCTDFTANQALYAKYTENRNGTLEQKETALKAGKEYLDKYKDCKDFEPQITWLKRNMEKLGPAVEAEKNALKEIQAAKERAAKFDKAVREDNGAEIFATGEDILKAQPEYLDLMIVLAMAGLDQTAGKKINTFNGKTIEYAKQVIKKLDEGDPSESKKYGVLGYERNTKENTLGWMNYVIGYVQYYGQKQTESGLEYLYKSTQLNSDTKDRDFIYAIVGDNYRDKAVALNDEIAKIIADKKKETFDSLSKLAMSKGYVERAMDAYARAYDVRKSNLQKEKDPVVKAKIQKSLDELFDTLKALYKFRFETIESPIPDTELPLKLNSHIASVTKTPFLSPAAAVVPVDPPSPDMEKTDGDSATSTTSTSGNTSTMPEKPKPMPAPATKPPTSKATTTGASVKSDADKSGNKPKKRR